jgi:hypothetical protein
MSRDRFRMRSLDFSDDLILPAVDSASNRNEYKEYSGDKLWPALKAPNLTAICKPIVWKMWEPRCLTTLWTSTTCYRHSFAFICYADREVVSEIRAECDMVINNRTQFCCGREICLKPGRLKIGWMLWSYSVPEAERVISMTIFLLDYTDISREKYLLTFWNVNWCAVFLFPGKCFVAVCVGVLWAGMCGKYKSDVVSLLIV